MRALLKRLVIRASFVGPEERQAMMNRFWMFSTFELGMFAEGRGGVQVVVHWTCGARCEMAGGVACVNAWASVCKVIGQCYHVLLSSQLQGSTTCVKLRCSQ